LEIQIQRLGVSIINEKPEELLYLAISDLSVAYEDSGNKDSLEIGVSDLQIDNQLPTTYLPVALFSTAKEPPLFLHFSMIRSKERTLCSLLANR